MGRQEFVRVIKDICVRRGWKVQSVSSDWILRIYDVQRIASTNIFGYVFDINNAASTEICKEKAAASQCLELEGIPTIKHEVFLMSLIKQVQDFVPKSGTWPKLLEFAKKHEYNIVVKPLKGTGGQGVYKITCQRDLEEASHDIFSRDYGLAACEFVDISNEFRVIWLDRPRLIYKKVRANIVGDGVSTVQQLTASYLSEAQPNKIAELSRALAEGPLSSFDKAIRIPKKGELVNLQWKHNLGHGASPRIISEEDEERHDLIALARAAVKCIGMKFCSVDIVSTPTGDYKVMEVNSGVMMDSAIVNVENGFSIATEIYEEALEAALVNQVRDDDTH